MARLDATHPEIMAVIEQLDDSGIRDVNGGNERAKAAHLFTAKCAGRCYLLPEQGAHEDAMAE